MNLDNYIGQAIEVEDPSARDHCMDWAFKVCDLRSINRAEIRNPAAKDVWQHHGATLEAHTDPQPLDFAIFGTGVGPYGHISVVKDGSRNNFRSWDQNWAGKQYVQVVPHSANGLLGFLRLKGTNSAPAQEEEVLGIGDVSKLFIVILGRQPYDYANKKWIDPGAANWVGQPWSKAVYEIADSPEGQAYAAKVQAALNK